MGFSRTVGAIGVIGVTVGGLGCADSVPSYPTAPACTVNCGSIGAGGVIGGTGGAGSTTTTTSTGSSGAAGTVEMTGNVLRFASADFDSFTVPIYSGTANIVAPGPSGSLTAPYDGSGNPPTFDLVGVSPGNQWVQVLDTTNGSAGILSTWSLVPLPIPTIAGQVTTVSLPVLDLGTLNSIAMDQLTTSANHVEPTAAQVVLLVSQGTSNTSTPLAGVSVTGNTGNASVAYDIGPGGSYSDAVSATGTAGTIILFNSALSGLVAISLLDAGSNAFAVQIQVTPGEATFVQVSIP